VTPLQGDYPLLRFATGDLSAWAFPGRLKGWMVRADQSAKVKGLLVHPGQIVEIGKRHPELRSARLVVRREGEQDAMTLHAETASPSETLNQAVAATWRWSRSPRCRTTARSSSTKGPRRNAPSRSGAR
jgi:phenylacetate-CoA ligase